MRQKRISLYWIHIVLLRRVRRHYVRKHALVCAHIRLRRLWLNSASDLIALRHSLAERIKSLTIEIESLKSGRLPATFSGQE